MREYVGGETLQERERERERERDGNTFLNYSLIISQLCVVHEPGHLCERYIAR